MSRVKTHPLHINLLIRQRFVHKAAKRIVANPANKGTFSAQSGDADRHICRCTAGALQQFTFPLWQ